MTAKYLLWRACERLGLDPVKAAERGPQFLSDLIAYARIRAIEEARER